MYREAYETYITSWSLTTAHETVHAFLTYLAGNKYTLTPTEIRPLDFRNPLRGESGREWELRAVGGMTRSMKNVQERFKKSPSVRAPSLWLKGNDKMAGRVSRETIENVALGSKLANLAPQLPLPPPTPSSPLFKVRLSPAMADTTEQKLTFPYRLDQKSIIQHARNSLSSLVCERLRRGGGSRM